MRECVREKAEAFRELNDLALREEIVILGSTYMASFPFYELINKCKLENAVYNRSIEGLTVAEAKDILQKAVLELKPSKVFLCFEESVGLHELIARIRAALPHTKVYVVGRQGDGAETLCDGKSVYYIGLASFETQAADYKRAFKQLCCFFRNKPLDITDAFAMAAL